VTNAPVKEWLPGDNVYDNAIYVPADFPAGSCDVQVAIVDKLKHQPRVNLAIEGRLSDGWYQMGKINITK